MEPYWRPFSKVDLRQIWIRSKELGDGNNRSILGYGFRLPQGVESRRLDALGRVWTALDGFGRAAGGQISELKQGGMAFDPSTIP